MEIIEHHWLLMSEKGQAVYVRNSTLTVKNDENFVSRYDLEIHCQKTIFLSQVPYMFVLCATNKYFEGFNCKRIE